MKEKKRIKTYYNPINTNMGILHPPKKKAIFNITTMLWETDKITLNGERRPIKYFIRNNPVELWNRINNSPNTEKKVTLMPQVYEKLKKAVMKIDPALIKEVINKNKSKQDLRKLKSLVASGKSPDRVGRFKKISSKRTQY